MKRWQIRNHAKIQSSKFKVVDIISILLENRGIATSQKQLFLHPKHPSDLTSEDVHIDPECLQTAVERIKKAINDKESIVVYADYDADGITAGTIMWETLHSLGAQVMPYIPHRVEEGYGFSLKGIAAVKQRYNPTLIISVDHGITAHEKIAYAKQQGIDVVVTDHHVKPEMIPDCPIVHTTELCGAGISWFVASAVLKAFPGKKTSLAPSELLALAAIGTIADMVPLIGACRSIAYYGLSALNNTERIGLRALITSAGIQPGAVTTYDVSHKIAPRLNAMGRLVHALDALRLLCTNNKEKAKELADLLAKTNIERQEMTEKNTLHAKDVIAEISKNGTIQKLLFVTHAEYNQGVIGLVAGKLVETYYRPAIVVSRGEVISKASARSIRGFNIIEAIRSCADILIDAGGHPMAAGFTVETKNLLLLEKRLLVLAEESLTAEALERVLPIDLELPLTAVTQELWQSIEQLQPFGMGNPEPVFAALHVTLLDARIIGRDGKHLKLALTDAKSSFDAVGFGFGELYPQLFPGMFLDVAYTIDMNEWNGKKRLQLKIRDIQFPESIEQTAA